MKFPPPTASCTLATPLGTMRMAATPDGLAGLWFEGQRHMPDCTGWVNEPTHPVLIQAMQQVQAYFQGQPSGFDVPLDLGHGTAFQQQVWQALLHIPRGRTQSYGELAAHIGKPDASRAVGAAVGRNPISILVPCHRVVGALGQLTGYAGGLERKRALLQLESPF